MVSARAAPEVPGSAISTTGSIEKSVGITGTQIGDESRFSCRSENGAYHVGRHLVSDHVHPDRWCLLCQDPCQEGIARLRLYEMTGAEQVWYVIMCIAFGAGYFAKIPMAKALSELPQYRSG